MGRGTAFLGEDGNRQNRTVEYLPCVYASSFCMLNMLYDLNTL